MPRCRAVLLLLPLLLAPRAAAQHAEADDVEAIKPPAVKPSPDENKPDLEKVVKGIIDKTNAFRKEEGRPVVGVDAKLARTAAAFAAYMAQEDRYGHTADGQRPAERAKKHGYDYCVVLENIAYQYSSVGFKTAALAEGFFGGWKESPGHRRNMLDPDVTQTGVAVARSEATGYYYAVQMFGRPKSEAIAFAISNESAAAIEYEIAGKPFVLEPRYTRTHMRCRPARLTYRLPGEKEKGTVKPANGDRFAVIEREGRCRLIRR